jgi:hypothetical protein
VALATSTAWFPAPEHPTPGAIAMGLLTPLMFGGPAAALWRRSLVWALVAIDGGGLSWSRKP